MKSIYRSIPHIETLKNTVNYILDSELSEYVSFIYLFGSLARKHFNAKSDIDILIEFSPEILSTSYCEKKIVELKKNIRNNIQYNIEIDILVEIGKEWEKDNSTFYNCIKKDKKIIYSKEGGVNYEF